MTQTSTAAMTVGATTRADVRSLALITCHPAHVLRIKAAYASGWQLESERETDVGQVVLVFTKPHQ